MLKTVEGFYQDGQVRLSDLPQEIEDQAQVLVTFLEPGGVSPDKLRQLMDQVETIIGVQQGLNEVDSGQTRSIEDFEKEMKQKHGISS